jgi:hypothetical protein
MSRAEMARIWREAKKAAAQQDESIGEKTGT